MNFDDIVKPIDGTLCCSIIEGEHPRLQRSLFFDIEIALHPFEFDGKQCSTSVRLGMIDFDVRRLDDLSGRQFGFPVNPRDGYIDGSVYLGQAHNLADTTRIVFGHMGEASVEMEIAIQFDFTDEGISNAFGRPAVVWQIPLCFDRSKLIKFFEKFHQGTK